MSSFSYRSEQEALQQLCRKKASVSELLARTDVEEEKLVDSLGNVTLLPVPPPLETPKKIREKQEAGLFSPEEVLSQRYNSSNYEHMYLLFRGHLPGADAEDTLIPLHILQLEQRRNHTLKKDVTTLRVMCDKFIQERRQLEKGISETSRELEVTKKSETRLKTALHEATQQISSLVQANTELEEKAKEGEKVPALRNELYALREAATGHVTQIKVLSLEVQGHADQNAALQEEVIRMQQEKEMAVAAAERLSVRRVDELQEQISAKVLQIELLSQQLETIEKRIPTRTQLRQMQEQAVRIYRGRMLQIYETEALKCHDLLSCMLQHIAGLEEQISAGKAALRESLQDSTRLEAMIKSFQFRVEKLHDEVQCERERRGQLEELLQAAQNELAEAEAEIAVQQNSFGTYDEPRPLHDRALSTSGLPRPVPRSRQSRICSHASTVTALTTSVMKDLETFFDLTPAYSEALTSTSSVMEEESDAWHKLLDDLRKLGDNFVAEVRRRSVVSGQQQFCIPPQINSNSKRRSNARPQPSVVGESQVRSREDQSVSQQDCLEVKGGTAGLTPRTPSSQHLTKSRLLTPEDKLPLAPHRPEQEGRRQSRHRESFKPLDDVRRSERLETGQYLVTQKKELRQQATTWYRLAEDQDISPQPLAVTNALPSTTASNPESKPAGLLKGLVKKIRQARAQPREQPLELPGIDEGLSVSTRRSARSRTLSRSLPSAAAANDAANRFPKLFA